MQIRKKDKGSFAFAPLVHRKTVPRGPESADFENGLQSE